MDPNFGHIAMFFLILTIDQILLKLCYRDDFGQIFDILCWKTSLFRKMNSTKQLNKQMNRASAFGS